MNSSANDHFLICYNSGKASTEMANKKSIQDGIQQEKRLIEWMSHDLHAGFSRAVVQPLDMVDNSISPCKPISGRFSLHSTVQGW
jgi:hypothetical protein